MKSASLVFVLVLSALSVSALPVPATGEAHHLFDLLPQAIRKFYKSLSDKDLETLETIGDRLEEAEQDHDVNGNEIYSVVRSQDRSLAERLKSMYETIEAKVEHLSEIPRKFINDIAEKFENVVEADDNADQIVADVEEAFKKADQLPASAKQEIVSVFPSFKQLFD